MEVYTLLPQVPASMFKHALFMSFTIRRIHGSEPRCKMACTAAK